MTFVENLYVWNWGGMWENTYNIKNTEQDFMSQDCLDFNAEWKAHQPRRKQYKMIAFLSPLRPKAQVYWLKGIAVIKLSICCSSKVTLKLEEQEFK